MKSKPSLKEQRDKALSGLRINATQTTSWQISVVKLLEELNRDNLLLRSAYGKLVQEVEALKRENIAA